MTKNSAATPVLLTVSALIGATLLVRRVRHRRLPAASRARLARQRKGAKAAAISRTKRAAARNNRSRWTA